MPALIHERINRTKSYLVTDDTVPYRNVNIWGFTCGNRDMIMRHVVMEDSGNFDRLVFFTVH